MYGSPCPDDEEAGEGKEEGGGAGRRGWRRYDIGEREVAADKEVNIRSKLLLSGCTT